MVIEVDHPAAGRVKLINTPMRFGTSDVGTTRPPPRLGEHTEDVLRQYLGLDPGAIAELRKAGVAA